jgi:hypothetical protein
MAPHTTTGEEIMAIPLEEFLQTLLRVRGEQYVLDAVRDAVHAVARGEGETVTQYVSRLGLDFEWRRPRALIEQFGAAARTGDHEARRQVVHALTLLARVLRVGRVPLGALLGAPPPWHRWRPGSTLVVLIGEQQVTMGRSPCPKWCSSRHDKLALQRLVNLMNDLGLTFRLELPAVPPGLGSEEATERLNELLKRDDVGAIVGLGSPMANSLAAPLARLALGGGEAPAKFRFASEVDPPDRYLCDPPARAGDPVGIRLFNHQEITFTRMPDEQVREQVIQGVTGPFPDVGMLIIDCHRPCVLLLAVGHGGDATEASCEALRHSVYLMNQLTTFAPGREDDPVYGRDRTVEIVTVRRHLRDRELAVDNLCFGEDDWELYWEGLPEEHD